MTTILLGMSLVIIFLFIANWQQSCTIKTLEDNSLKLLQSNSELLVSVSELIDCLKLASKELDKYCSETK